MSTQNSPYLRRFILMVTGNFFIGVSVNAYRLSTFGTDSYTCMNLAISSFLHISFGTWQLIMNCAILAVIFFQARECIGIGTIVNMVCIGYLSDFICWMSQDILHIRMGLPFRILSLIAGSIFAGAGIGFYIAAEMGIAPYDSVAIVIEKLTKGKISFQYARILSDVTIVTIGIVFCLLSHGPLWHIVGIGTICNALLNGVLIQFFRTHIAEPLLHK